MTDTAETVAITAAARQRMLDRLAATGGAHLAPIVETLAEGVAVLFLPASKLRFDMPKRRSWIALIGDDLFFAEGPAGFHLRSLRKLLGQAHFVSVMSGAPVAKAYQGAADIAGSGLNVVLIETQPAEERSWLEFVYRHAPKAAKQIVSPNAKAWKKAA